ncbi:MAG: C4-dicarboxylate ABC transporter [Hyphomicrobiales bacterium]|nr:MAG: C4-dicarboxylate ABC transporter [Hyphomicrobiales bacterium]
MKINSFRNIAGMAMVGALGLLSSVTSAVAADVVILKLHQFLPGQATVPKQVLQVWGAKIEEQSKGRIKIQHYPSMQLGGKPPELIDQVIDGVVDIIWTVNGYTPGRFPRTEVFELPFIQKDAQETTQALWTMFEKDMKDNEFKDMHVLGVWVHGPGLLHSDKPVKTVEDMKGLKVRGGSRAINMMLKQFGATAVGMPVPAVSEALSKGVINATTIPWEVAAAVKVPELVSNHTEFTGNALYTVTFVMAMNKEKYASLPDDLKKIIDDNSGLEFSVNAAKIMQDFDAPVRAKAVEQGNNIIVLNADESAVWAAAAAPVYDTWAKEMDDKGFDGKALIAEAKALLLKSSKMSN